MIPYLEGKIPAKLKLLFHGPKWLSKPLETPMASVDVFQRSRYTTSVDRMLRDPKGGDPEGVSRLDVYKQGPFKV